MKYVMVAFLSCFTFQAKALDWGHILTQVGSCLVGGALLNNVPVSPENGNKDAIYLGCTLGVGVHGYLSRDTWSRGRLNIPGDPTQQELRQIMDISNKYAPPPKKKSPYDY
jgi:hypothetical protein